LIGPGDQFMPDDNSRPWTKALTARQVQAVDFLIKKGSLTNRMYQQLAAVSRATAKRDLQDLVYKGIFQVSGTGRGLCYILNPEWSPGKPL
jgi:predicted HTH transcriptional regulator